VRASCGTVRGLELALGGLLLPQPGIGATPLQQLRVGAALDDTAALEHQVVEAAAAGSEVAVKLGQPVRRGDAVYLLKE